MSASVVTSYLCYEKPDEAALWLCEAFGFDKEDTARDADGRLIYFSLRAGRSCILIGPSAGTRFDGLVVNPLDIDGKSTQVCYLAVDDVEAHCLRAQSAGAQIETSPVDDSHDQSYYLCRDIEGHLWSFGAHCFDVSASTSADTMAPVAINAEERPKVSRTLAAAVMACLVAFGVWSVASNSDLFANAKLNEATAIKPATVVRNVRAPADSSPPKQTGAQAPAATLIKIAAADRQLEKTLRETEAKLANLREQKKNAEEALLKEREISKVALHEKQRVIAKLQADTETAATILEQAQQELIDARNEIAMLDRARQRAMEKTADTGRRYGELMSQVESLRSKLQTSRRTEATVRAALVAEQVTAGRAKKGTEAAEARQREMSRSIESIVQQLRAEHQRARKARKMLEAASKRVGDVYAETIALGRSVSGLRGAGQTSNARLEVQLSALADSKAKAPQRASGVHPDKAEPKSALPKPDDERTKITKAKETNVDTMSKKESAKVAETKDIVTASVQPPHVEAVAAKRTTKTKKKALPAGLGLNSRCSRMAWSRFFKHRRSSSAGTVRTVNRLCANARSSSEPVRCLQHIMAGKVNWGSGKRWPMRYALRLCSGSLQASATIGCFRSLIESNHGWRSALSQCAKN